jgi:transposase-like protein
MTFSHSLSQIPTEKKIAKELKHIIYGKHVSCPDCGRKNSVVTLILNKKWRCKKCRIKFSITSRTWLKGMKISYTHLWALIWCWQKKINIQQTNALLHLSIVTIRRYYELFRDNLQTDYEVLLEGQVQIDEMFVKHAFIIGGKDISMKKIKLQVKYYRHPHKDDAMNLMFHYVKPGSTICTDGGSIYRTCDKWWPITHKKEIHSKFQFSITSEIEGIWANLRTFIRRMYHHVTLKKLTLIVREFETRFNHPEIFDFPLNYLKNSLSPVTLAL